MCPNLTCLCIHYIIFCTLELNSYAFNVFYIWDYVYNCAYIQYMELWTASMSSQNTLRFDSWEIFCMLAIYSILRMIMIAYYTDWLQLRDGWSLGVCEISSLVMRCLYSFIDVLYGSVFAIDRPQSKPLAQWVTCLFWILCCSAICSFMGVCAAGLRDRRTESWYCYFICLYKHTPSPSVHTHV